MTRDRSGPLDFIYQSPVTWLITAINIGVFLIAWTRGEHRGEALTPQTLLQFGALDRGAIWSGEYWRFASAMCLHLGWFHLLWNTYAGFGFDAAVERAVGSWRFGVAYVASGIGASAVSVLGHASLSAGASGAAFGIIGMTLCLFYRRAGSLAGFLDDPNVKQTFVSIGVWTVIGLMAFRMDHYAHFGGLFFGILVGAVLTGRSFQRNAVAQAVAGAVVAAILAGTVAAAAYPWPGREPGYSGALQFERAAEAFDRKDWAGAVEHYTRAEAAGFRFHGLYHNRALAYWRLGQLENAEQDLTRALELDGGQPDSLFYRGAVRRERGDVKGAAEDVRRALERAPKDWVHRLRARELLEEGDKK